MFDLRAIRDNPQAFDQAWAKKGLSPQTGAILALDAQIRDAKTSRQDAEAIRNRHSKQIGKAKATGDEAEAQRLMDLVSDAKKTIESAGETVAHLSGDLQTLMLSLPNIPLADVPEGADESENQLAAPLWGMPRKFTFTPKDHVDLGAALKTRQGQPMMDFESAARLSGARFVALRGELARLERALALFMLDLQTGSHGYEEVSPPLLVRSDALIGTGQLPKFGEDSFATTDGLWLIATSEIALTNLIREDILRLDQLPMRMCAHTPCFRSEAGSAGRDTRGMIRLHQFDKVELVSIVAHEAAGLEELERMTGCAEAVLQALDLPYRKMLLCAGDMGFGARKTYDLEVWLPTQETYREISSCSYCGDFQGRRMQARYRPPESEETPRPKPEFVHTLNGSGLAVGRTLVAVMENYQNEDGSITIPDVLQDYMGGQTQIGG